MVERSIAWLVADGHRRVRYRGVTRKQHGLSLRVAAINLRRLLILGLTATPTGWVLTERRRARGVKEGRLCAKPSIVAGLHPQMPALRIGHLPGPPAAYRPTHQPQTPIAQQAPRACFKSWGVP
jgi:hypothetical protein